MPVTPSHRRARSNLSVQFDLIDRLGTNEAIRRFLLEQAGFAVVPFQAFGVKQDDGWFRLSAGAVSVRDCEVGLQRVRAALAGLPWHSRMRSGSSRCALR